MARPEVEGLFTWPSEAPQLIAGRCSECGCHFFPHFAALHRPGCPGEKVERVTLPRVGRVVSFTVQRYQPPPPFPTADHYEPVVICMVAFDEEGLTIPGQMVGIEAEQVSTGMEVEVTADTLYRATDGTPMLTWKFIPARTSRGAGGVKL